MAIIWTVLANVTEQFNMCYIVAPLPYPSNHTHPPRTKSFKLVPGLRKLSEERTRVCKNGFTYVTYDVGLIS